MEQPDGSFMYQVPSCGEIVHHTQPCRFDLCRVWRLKDPETALPILKRLHVRSTSMRFQEQLHGKLCQQEHEHRQIAGSIRVGEQRINMTAFTENYPRKFARQVAKILLHDVRGEIPIFAQEESQ